MELPIIIYVVGVCLSLIMWSAMLTILIRKEARYFNEQGDGIVAAIAVIVAASVCWPGTLMLFIGRCIAHLILLDKEK